MILTSLGTKSSQVNISTQSTPSNKINAQKPKYTVYYSEDEDEGIVKDIIVKMEVQMLVSLLNHVTN
jgi:hypothetical protein